MGGELGRVRGVEAVEQCQDVKVGAQGGDAKATVQAGLTAQGLISVNSSRAILYTSSGADFADAARAEAIRTRDLLNTASSPR